MIADIGKIGKGLLDKLLIPAIIILVAIAAFGLGRLSALHEQQGSLVIHQSFMQQ